jgi:hypothetical protein
MLLIGLSSSVSWFVGGSIGTAHARCMGPWCYDGTLPITNALCGAGWWRCATDRWHTAAALGNRIWRTGELHGAERALQLLDDCNQSRGIAADVITYNAAIGALQPT